MAEPKGGWSVEWVLLAVLAALVAGVGAALWLLPRERETLEYSGTCGRFRTCTRRLWFFGRCSPGLPGLPSVTPFAPAEACEGDWHLLSESLDYVRPFGRYQDRYVERTIEDEPVPTILALYQYLTAQRTARTKHGAYDPKLDPLNMSVAKSSYELMDCAGVATRFSPTEFTVVLGTGPAEGPPTDCWAITHTGELRHILKR